MNKFTKVIENSEHPFDSNLIESKMKELKKYVEDKGYTESLLDYRVTCIRQLCVLQLHLQLNDKLYIYVIDFSNLRISKKTIQVEGTGKPEDIHKKQEFVLKNVPLAIGIQKSLEWIEKEVKGIID
jgi:hypothetical protein